MRNLMLVLMLLLCVFSFIRAYSSIGDHVQEEPVSLQYADESGL